MAELSLGCRREQAPRAARLRADAAGAESTLALPVLTSLAGQVKPTSS